MNSMEISKEAIEALENAVDGDVTEEEVSGSKETKYVVGNCAPGGNPLSDIVDGFSNICLECSNEFAELTSINATYKSRASEFDARPDIKSDMIRELYNHAKKLEKAVKALNMALVVPLVMEE